MADCGSSRSWLENYHRFRECPKKFLEVENKHKRCSCTKDMTKINFISFHNLPCIREKIGWSCMRIRMFTPNPQNQGLKLFIADRRMLFETKKLFVTRQTGRETLHPHLLCPHLYLLKVNQHIGCLASLLITCRNVETPGWFRLLACEVLNVACRHSHVSVYFKKTGVFWAIALCNNVGGTVKIAKTLCKLVVVSKNI